MPARTKTRTGVKPEDVDTVKALLNAEKPPPTKIDVSPDGNGTFTIVATWS